MSTSASPPSESTDALVAALIDIERHVTSVGWDQPARLFALVGTGRLLAAEPSLAAHLVQTASDALSSIEQDEFRAGDDLLVTLERISWPAEVEGCALAVERNFLPAECEADLPDDPEAAAAAVARHPRRQDVRVVVGAMRNGATHGVARLVSNPDDLLGSADLVPGLASALQRTFI